MRQLAQLFRDHWIIILAVFLYLISVGTLASLRHAAFQTQAWDLGVFDQIFWNTIHGRPFVNSFEGGSHLGTHFTPFLLFLVPFYWIIPSPYTLLWLQTLALAVAAIPLYLLARMLLGTWTGTTIALAYLLYPWLHAVNLFDFHEEPFAIPLLFAAFYFWEKRRTTLAICFFGLAAMTKENAAFAVVFAALYLLLKNWRKKASWIFTLAGAAYFAAVSLFVLAGRGEEMFLLRYGALGGSPGAVLKTALTHPGTFFAIILTKPKLFYLLRLLSPVLFAPLVAPLTIILLTPGLAQNLLSAVPTHYANLYQYDALLIPFLFLALIEACRILRQILPEYITRLLPPIILAAAFGSFLYFSPAGPVRFSGAAYRVGEREQILDRLIATVPAAASVAAGTNIVPHLTQRGIIYPIGSEPQPMDVVLFDGGDPFPFSSLAGLAAYANHLAASGLYHITLVNNRYYVLERKTLPGN